MSNRRTKIGMLIGVGALAVVAVAVAVGRGGGGTQTVSASGSASGPSATTLTSLANSCASTVDPASGFGTVTISGGVHIVGQTATINSPCTIHLAVGSTLDLTNSHLTSNHLVIVDDNDGGGVSQVNITNTTVSGQTGSGLFVRLRHANDSISVTNSTLRYDRSINLVTTNDDSTGQAGDITMLNSHVFSEPAISEGITVSAGGNGKFNNDDFHTPANDGVAVLWGQLGCKMNQVTGTPPACTA